MVLREGEIMCQESMGKRVHSQGSRYGFKMDVISIKSIHPLHRNIPKGTKGKRTMRFTC